MALMVPFMNLKQLLLKPPAGALIRSWMRAAYGFLKTATFTAQ